MSSANVEKMSFFGGVDGAASPAPASPPATPTPTPATPTASPTAATNVQQITAQVQFTGRGVGRWGKSRTAGVKRVMRHRFRKLRRKAIRVKWGRQRRSDDSESITMEFEVDTDLSPEQMPEMLDEMRAFLTAKRETGFCKEFAVDADDELVSESSVTSFCAKRMQSSGMDEADDDNKKSKGPPVLVIVGAAAGVMMLLLLGAGFVFWQRRHSKVSVCGSDDLEQQETAQKPAEQTHEISISEGVAIPVAQQVATAPPIGSTEVTKDKSGACPVYLEPFPAHAQKGELFELSNLGTMPKAMQNV